MGDVDSSVMACHGSSCHLGHARRCARLQDDVGEVGQFWEHGRSRPIAHARMGVHGRSRPISGDEHVVLQSRTTRKRGVRVRAKSERSHIYVRARKGKMDKRKRSARKRQVRGRVGVGGARELPLRDLRPFIGRRVRVYLPSGQVAVGKLCLDARGYTVWKDGKLRCAFKLGRDYWVDTHPQPARGVTGEIVVSGRLLEWGRDY